jgi:hypothetical protein
MSRTLNILVASIGIFFGSLLSDSVFGDGIQTEDLLQAATLGLLSAVIQWWLNRRR